LWLAQHDYTSNIKLLKVNVGGVGKAGGATCRFDCKQAPKETHKRPGCFKDFSLSIPFYPGRFHRTTVDSSMPEGVQESEIAQSSHEGAAEVTEIPSTWHYIDSASGQSIGPVDLYQLAGRRFKVLLSGNTQTFHLLMK
jgi:hypothetical protein